MQDNQLSTEELIAKDVGARLPEGVMAKLIAGLALLWSLFQLWIASPLPFMLRTGVFNNTEARSIHLAFALLLAFLAYPAFKRSPRDRVPLIDIALGLIAAASAGYLFIAYEQLAQRPGNLTTMDLVTACIGIPLLLEATRRALGPALAVIALIFLGYSLAGPYMPGLLAHRGVSFTALANHQWITTEGVFGIALGVSTSFVFLFVLFGALLERAGAGHYFIQLAFSLLGHFRGGPAKAAVVASGMTGLISGSSIANVVTTGTFTIPMMKRTGFSAEKAGAVEVASSVNGQIMPPVMGAAAFLMTEFVGISYAEVVKHAFVPAIISYVALFYIVHLEAAKAGMPVLEKLHQSPVLRRLFNAAASIAGIVTLSLLTYYIVEAVSLIFGDVSLPVIAGLLIVVYLGLLLVASRQEDLVLDDPDAPLVSVPDTLPILLSGLHYVIPIGVLIWCLMIERFSPGLSVFWATVAMVAILLTQKPLIALMRGIDLTASHLTAGLTDLANGMISGSRNMVAVAVAMAAAGIIVGVVSLTGVGLVMSGVIDTLANGNVFLMLVITAIMCVVLGMGLPTTANYIVVASIMAHPLVTLAAQSGVIIPLIAVHLFVFYFGLISGTTPPVAVDAFAGAAVARANPMKTCIQSFFYSLRTAILPFIFVFNQELLLIGVDDWLHGLIVIGCSLIAMLSFSAATQGFMLVRSHKWESFILLVVSLSLLRPGFWLDRIEPPFLSVEPTQLLEIVGSQPDGSSLRLSLEGENFSGRMISKVAVLPLGPADEDAQRRLLDHAGLSIQIADGRVEVEDVRFGSAAQQSGIDFGWQVLEVQIPTERVSKEWLYIPFLMILLIVVGLQYRRMPRTEK